jgi:hypothetical protein
MRLTIEKLLLLGADFLVLPDFTELRWREWEGEWVEKKRKITPEKSNLFFKQAARIKEIQLDWLN